MGPAAPTRLRVSQESQLLEVAVDAARAAGGLLLERVGRGAESEVEAKSTPTDLVSAADLAAETAIRELLRERRPHDGFVGEEGGSEEGSSGLHWVVDPLDGTVNFLFGIPQWCVSVAVRDGEGTVAGAVYDANRDELFTATRGGQATLLSADGSLIELKAGAVSASAAHSAENRDAEGAGQAPAAQLSTAMVATGLAYDATVRAAQALVLARLIPLVRDVRRFGSAALDLAWTAMGRYDAYFERTVKEWDIAAGALICERAGLVVQELPARKNLPWGVLVARPGLAEQLLELVG
jgi:myo-inositol-1(or 4)-monophosphatase